jgi:hypothetical protein
MASSCEHSNEHLGSIRKVGCSLTSLVTVDFLKTIIHHVVNYLISWLASQYILFLLHP